MTDKTKTKTQVVKVTTPEFRVSFPSVFQPRRPVPGAVETKPKYAITMLFRVAPLKGKDGSTEEEAVDMAPLKAEVKRALMEEWGPDAQKWPKNLRLPFRKGEEKEFQGYGPGVVFCTATSVERPGLVDRNRQPILEASEFYAGCWARATVNAFAYDKAGNKGVAFGLRNIQKLRDGEPFSGRTKAEDDFDAIPAPDGTADANDPMGSVPF